MIDGCSLYSCDAMGHLSKRRECRERRENKGLCMTKLAAGAGIGRERYAAAEDELNGTRE